MGAAVVAVIKVLTNDNDARLNTALHLKTASKRLVMIWIESAGFNVRFDLQAVSGRLVVIRIQSSGFNVRFDLHTRFSPFQYRY
jgi:hypothetical protein